MEPKHIDDLGIKKIRKLITPLMGLPAWRAYSGISNLFNIQFGDLEIRDGRISSEWSIFNSGIPWEIEFNNKIHVDSNDSRLKILERLRIIEGQLLIDIEFILREEKTILHFNDVLVYLHNKEIPGVSNPERNFWSIFMPQKRYLSILPGNYWLLEEDD